MQVGMVGSDGILLASDTQWTQQGSIRHSFSATKIKINHARGIAVSCARNMETSARVADSILAGSQDAPPPYPSDVEKLAAKALREAGPRSDIQCLIVSKHTHLRFLRLQTILLDEEPAPMCGEVDTKAIIGDDTNAAIFWAERYYQRRPIRSLVLLAAQLVISARGFNSAMISGLEIVLCDATGIHRLGEDSIRQLESKANEIDDILRASFASYSEEFTYAPDVGV